MLTNVLGERERSENKRFRTRYFVMLFFCGARLDSSFNLYPPQQSRRVA